jgi:hypothetical protein
MLYYPLNEEKRTKKFSPPKNSIICKSNFGDNNYLLEIDFDLLPNELSIEQKEKIVEAIYRMKTN